MCLDTSQQRFIIWSDICCSLPQIWSPFCSPGTTDEDDQPRRMYSHQQYINLVINTGTGLAHDYTSQSLDEDPRMIAFFDSLVQREVDRSFSDSDDSELSPDSLYLNFAVEESESSRESESESSISSFQASLIRMSELARDEEEDSGNSEANVMLLLGSKRKNDDGDSDNGSEEGGPSKKRKDNHSQDRQGTSSGAQSKHHSKSDAHSGGKRKHDSQTRHSSSDDSSSSDDDDESLDVHESRIKSRIMRRLASKHKRLKQNEGQVNSHRFRRMQSQLDHDRMINLRQRWAYCKALKARMAKSQQEEPRLVVRVPNEDNLDIIAEHLDRSASREQRAAISRLRRRVLQEESIQDSPESHELSQSVRRPSSPTRENDQKDNTKVQSTQGSKVKGESSKLKGGSTSSQKTKKERCSKCKTNHCKCESNSADNPSTSSNCNSANTAGGSGQDGREGASDNWKDFKRFKNRITRAKSKRQYRTNSNADKSKHEDESESD